MNQTPDSEFSTFFKQRLQPLAAELPAAQRRSRRLALIAAAGVFVLFAVPTFFFLLPLLRSIAGVRWYHWLLGLALPTAMGTLAFAIGHILTLRRVVVDFQRSLLEHLAQYIAAGTVLDTADPVTEKELENSRLFSAGEKLEPTASFRAFGNNFTARFCQIKTVGKNGDNGREGIFFTAILSQPSPVSLLSTPGATGESTGDGWQLRTVPDFPPCLVGGADGKTADNLFATPFFKALSLSSLPPGTTPRLALRDDTLRLALLRESIAPAAVDAGFFDFAGMREFARNARLCLAVAGGFAAFTVR